MSPTQVCLAQQWPLKAHEINGISRARADLNSYLKVDVWLCIRYYPLHAEHIFRKVSSWKDLKACSFSLVLYKGTWPFSDPNFSSFPPPSTLPPACYVLKLNGLFFPLFFFFKIVSKIIDQRQWWCKLKSRVPQYFTRNLLFSEQSRRVKFGAVCIATLWLAPGEVS